MLAGACTDAHLALSPAPALYSDDIPYPAETVPEHQRSTEAALYYVTDRNMQPASRGGVAYGHERSASMAFGVATTRFGGVADWTQLVERSTLGGRRIPVDLTVTHREEIARFPATPLEFELRDGRPVTTEAARAAQGARIETFQRTMAQALKASARPDALVFIHGFRHDFDEGHASLANIWHYSGRASVPVLYSWPAGNPGLFGYFRDRESGEFTVHHLKQFLRMLADTPGLERIQIVAHSRGTDIATTALRELIIAERSAGRDPRATLKVDALILAAPDLDFGVVGQRLVAERFGPAFGQITAYLNPDDNRLGLAEALMSGTRFGRISFDEVAPQIRTTLANVPNVHFVNVSSVTGRHRHSYFRNNPHVLADIVLKLRTGASPGTPERPLEPAAGNFWRLPPDYPAQDIPGAYGVAGHDRAASAPAR